MVEGLGEVDSDIMKVRLWEIFLFRYKNISLQIIVEKRPEEEEEEEVEFSTPTYPEIINNEDRAGITDLNTGEIIVVGDDEEDSEGSDEYAEDVTNPAVEAEETTEKVEKEGDATGLEKAHNFVKLVRADGQELEELDGTKENPWIPFDEDKDIIDYQYEVKAERENQEDMVSSFFRLSSSF